MHLGSISSAGRGLAASAITLLALTLSSPTLAAIVRVPQDWPTIQEAINHCVNDDVVLIADGVWTGVGNYNLNFGGLLITVKSASGNPDACIIDCQNAGRGFVFNSGETSAATVQGLTIRNGRATGGRGGAISCLSSDPTILNCKFLQCTATAGGTSTGGGGAIVLDASDATLNGCWFESNTAMAAGNLTGFGGALSIRNSIDPTIDGCTFLSNTATQGTTGFRGFGGAVSVALSSRPTFTGCTFEGNSSYLTGGAMFIGSSSDATLVNCTFDGNTTDGSGGGLVIDGSSGASADLDRCTFTGNDGVGSVASQAGLGGGGIVNVGGTLVAVSCRFDGNSSTVGGGISTPQAGSSTLINCLFHHNQATDASAVNSSFGSSTTVVNSTVTENTAATSSGAMSAFATGSTLNVSNSVVWGNTPASPQISELAGGIVNVTYSDVQGGWPGTGNIMGDPLFVDSAGMNYRLAAGSPAIDAGSNPGVPPDIETDLDGNDRFVDDPDTVDSGVGTPPIVDMGCYEFQPEPPCPADTDGSGTVDVDDLTAVILDWGSDGSGNGGDIDGSGVVDVDDLTAVILGWGLCP